MLAYLFLTLGQYAPASDFLGFNVDETHWLHTDSTGTLKTQKFVNPKLFWKFNEREGWELERTGEPEDDDMLLWEFNPEIIRFNFTPPESYDALEVMLDKHFDTIMWGTTQTGFSLVQDAIHIAKDYFTEYPDELDVTLMACFELNPVPQDREQAGMALYHLVFKGFADSLVL